MTANPDADDTDETDSPAKEGDANLGDLDGAIGTSVPADIGGADSEESLPPY